MTSSRNMIKIIKKHLSKYWLHRVLRLNVLFYLKLRTKFKTQLTSAKWKGNTTLESGQKVIIPLIETSHYQIYQVLALAKAFELRGAKVKVLICDSVLPGCEIKSIRSPALDPCLSCRFNRNNALKFFKLDLVSISDFMSPVTLDEIKAKASEYASEPLEKYMFKNVDLAPSVNDSIIRFYYGAVPDKNSVELRKIREKHLVTAMISLLLAEAIETTWTPDIVFNNMNVYSSWEPFYRYFESLNVQTHVISISPFNYNAVTINAFDLFRGDKRLNMWLKERNSQYLNENEDALLSEFIEKRFSGNSKIFMDSGVFDLSESIFKQIQIDKNKKNIFLFSNIYWDVGMSESATLYDGVIKWVLETIGIVEGREDCHLFIKPHPAEVYDGSSSIKSVRDFIADKYPQLPNNVTMIHPEFKLKTYDLFPFIDLGVVYNGTLGLEMMLHDIPVIVCGLSPYGFLKSATIPDSIQSYENLLVGKLAPSKPQLQEVRLFSYFYFIKTMIPWTLSESAYAQNFDGFAFNSLDDLEEGKDKYLDHICNSILKADTTVIESW